MTFDLCSRSVEFRAGDNRGDGRTLEGYAAVFDQDTEINSWEGKFVERVARGAFKKTLSEKKPIMQYDHGRDARVGSVPIGVYEDIREDKHGLFVSGRVFDNDVVEPVRQAIEGGAITGMSFKFRVTRDEWHDNKGVRVKGDEIYKLMYEPGSRGPLRRTIREVQLYEAGPVASPAYDGTSVGVRSMTDADREALAAEYRKTMIEDAEERAEDYERDQAERFPEGELQRWLDAENEWRTAMEAWLEAERSYHAAKLDSDTIQQTPAETDDAVREDTSSTAETPEDDAARTGTSHRESTTKSLPTPKEKAMTLEELREKLAALDVRRADLAEEFRDAEMPADIETEFEGIPAARAKVEASIAKIEARKAELMDLAQKGNAVRGDHEAPAVHTRKATYNLDEIRSASTSPEDFVLRAKDNALRVIETIRTAAGTDKTKSQERMAELLDNVDDEFGTLAKRFTVASNPAYERAFGKMVKAQSKDVLSQEELRDLSLGSDANGGYAVPVQLDPTVIHTSALQINPLRGLARHIEITGKEWQGVTSAGISVSRGAEASAVAGTSPTFAQPTARTNRVAAFVPFSLEIDADWGQMRAEISSMLAEAKEVEEATSFTNGDGTGTNAGGLITTLAAGSNIDSAASLTNPFGNASPTSANLYKLEEALPVRYRGNAQWMANKAVFNKVRQLDAVGNGPDLWERIGAGLPSQILGYSIHENTAMSGLPAGATNTRVLVFGDFSKGFIIVDRIGMSVELVPHVFSNPSGTAVVPTGQRGIFAVWRNNSKVLVDDAFRVLRVQT
jgi:HK97 family phage major capsid protein/HK97 family phage prohead protease